MTTSIGILRRTSSAYVSVEKEPRKHDAQDETLIIRLIEHSLGLSKNEITCWPGITAYCQYLEQEWDKEGPKTFEPLLESVCASPPPTFASCIDLLCRVCTALEQDNMQSSSIDEVVNAVRNQGRCLETTPLSTDEVLRNRKAIFYAISWLTMLMHAACKEEEEQFRIAASDDAEDSCRAQNIDMARRPIAALLRSFSSTSLMPGPNVDFTASNLYRSGDLIYVSSIHYVSLRNIAKIRIQWTQSLAEHLHYLPSTRTLLVFRYPTFCALACAAGRNSSVVNR